MAGISDLDQQINQLPSAIKTNRKPLWEHIMTCYIDKEGLWNFTKDCASFQHNRPDPDIAAIIEHKEYLKRYFTSHFPSYVLHPHFLYSYYGIDK